jgi:hypothetical protein
MEVDASSWSGEGAFTQSLLDVLKALAAVTFLRVEDAPASRSETSYSFVSNEIYVGFGNSVESGGSLAALAQALQKDISIGAPDYADEGMLQYLRTERVVPAYQTRGFKMIEMVRIYKLPGQPQDAPAQ